MVMVVNNIDILGVKVADLDENSVIDKVLELARDKKGGHYVVTINSEFVMLARRNQRFRKILNGADLGVADGVGVVLAKLISGGKCHNRVTGVDLLEKLCAKSAGLPIRIGFLGGFGDVAKVVSERQKSKNRRLSVVLAEPGDPAIGQDLRLRKTILGKKRIDILFVAYGMGRQELWIERNRRYLPVGVFIGVGGAFDYISMVKMRAPKLIRDAGFEWLWRLLMEPQRFWRMRVLPAFAFLVIRRWLSVRGGSFRAF